MHLRAPSHSFLIVAAGGYPIAVLRGLPRPERLARIARGEALVYDLGRLHGKDHARLAAALGTLRELPYLADGAPTALLVGGTPAMTIRADGKQDGVGARFLDLLRTTR